MLSRRNSFIDVVKSRRSVRRFLDKQVSDNLIKKIIEAATWAPSTCNQQLWNFVVVKDKGTKNRLIHEAASTTLIGRAPVVIVITYEKSNYKEAIQGATAAMQNMLLATTYYGLGSCSINSFGNEKKIKKILNIPNDQMIVCFVTLGYKNTKFYEKLNPPPRRELSKVLHLEKFKRKRNNIFSYLPDNWTIEDIKDYQRYYCRKTFLGKEMDIMTWEEKEIAAITLRKAKGHILDWFTYDGAYLSLFPNEKIYTIDLTDETSHYTKAAAALVKDKKLDITYLVYDTSFKDLKKRKKKFRTITSIYKFERIPKKFLNAVLNESYELLDDKGEFIIIFRKKSILYRLFYFVLKVLFGDDIRNTGIYAFFGPYIPLDSKRFVKLLKNSGFKNIKKECYFPFPTFFDQAYQMVLQYIKSGGTSYLHRIRREDFITKIIKFLVNIYGFRQTTFGTVCVVTAKK
ncbi:nitroreductase family protein [Candidatus Woesearchaeota archaeon]|nr:nitroreductase family protein [Candidatus Woesearchaeota archaeon]